MNSLAGLNILGFVADDSACGYLRVRCPIEYAAKLGANARWCKQVNQQELMAADYILAQRQYNEDILWMLEMARDSGKTVIYEVDDYLHGVHEDSPAYRVYKQGTKELSNAEKAIANASGLTVTTNELAAFYLKLNRNTYVLPNAIDWEMRNWSKRVENRDPALTVGWSGGNCYDNLTEVLTEEGFKLFRDLTMQDKIATLDPLTHELEYAYPSEIVIRKYKGPLHEIDNKYVSCGVTPNHWMYIRLDGQETYSEMQAEVAWGEIFYVKKNAKWTGTSKVDEQLLNRVASWLSGIKKVIDYWDLREVLTYSSEELLRLVGIFIKHKDELLLSKGLEDFVIELCLKAGVSADALGDSIRVNKKSEALVEKDHQSISDYKGNIYCVTVPNHTLYVRRNGKSFWCMNTHQKDIPYIWPIAKMVLNKYPHVKFALQTSPDMASMFMANKEMRDFGDRIIILPPAPLDRYPEMLTHFDIGVAPLAFSSFNVSKCLDKNTRVSTDNGMISLHEANVGDMIWNKDHWTDIEAIERQPKQIGYRITTDYGFSVLATKEHRFPTPKGDVTVENLAVGDTLLLSRMRFNSEYQEFGWPLLLTRHSKNSLDNYSMSGISCPIVKIDENWGRLMGYIAGDGSINGGHTIITCDSKDEDVIEDVTITASHLGLAMIKKDKYTFDKQLVNCKELIVSSRNLVDILEHLGLAKAKGWGRKRNVCVPDIIFKSPKSVVANFLAAYFESDGTATKNGSIQIVSKYKKMMEDVQLLLLGFGITAKLSKRVVGTGTYKGNIYWNLLLPREEREIFCRDIGFIGRRKRTTAESSLQKKWSNHSKPISFAKEIVSIEPEEIEPIDIQTSDGYFTANGFVTHNSSLKFEEHLAWGIPIVGARIAPYQRFVNEGPGAFTADTPYEWEQHLSRLIEDEKFRKETGEAGRERILDNNSYSTQIHKWVETWEDIRLQAMKGNTGSGVDVDMKIGRNDLCPCGSKKKYKKCCYPAWGK